MSERNRKDVEADIPASIKDEVEFRFVRTLQDALEVVWGGDAWNADEPSGKGRSEARL
jgi:hypothetical protein